MKRRNLTTRRSLSRAFLAALTLTVAVTAGWSQTGYIWLIGEDSARLGAVRQTYYEGEGRGLEIKRWNKQRERYAFRKVREFAVKSDTFRVFNELQLTQGNAYWMEVALAKPVCRGFLNLYVLQSSYKMSSSVFDVGTDVYIVEDPETGAIQPLTGDIYGVLGMYIPEKEIAAFFKGLAKKPRYRDLQILICEFNRRQR